MSYNESFNQAAPKGSVCSIELSAFFWQPHGTDTIFKLTRSRPHLFN